MSLDTEAIRARLDAIEDALDYDVTDTSLLRQAPTDIAALLAEVERLRAENEVLRSDVARAKTLLDDTRRHCDRLAERLQRLDLLDLPY